LTGRSEEERFQNGRLALGVGAGENIESRTQFQLGCYQRPETIDTELSSEAVAVFPSVTL